MLAGSADGTVVRGRTLRSVWFTQMRQMSEEGWFQEVLLGPSTHLKGVAATACLMSRTSFINKSRTWSCPLRLVRVGGPSASLIMSAQQPLVDKLTSSVLVHADIDLFGFADFFLHKNNEHPP